MAVTDAASSCSPQPNAQPPPPIAQAPKPTRVICMSVPPKGTVGNVSLIVLRPIVVSPRKRRRCPSSSEAPWTPGHPPERNDSIVPSDGTSAHPRRGARRAVPRGRLLLEVRAARSLDPPAADTPESIRSLERNVSGCDLTRFHSDGAGHLDTQETSRDEAALGSGDPRRRPADLDRRELLVPHRWPVDVAQLRRRGHRRRAGRHARERHDAHP